MKKQQKLQEPESSVVVTAKYLDFAGTSDYVDAVARAEAIANRRSTHRGGAAGGESTDRTLTRSFDEDRYIIRHYVPEREGSGSWDIYRVSPHLFIMVGDCQYNRPKWLGSPGEHCLKIRYLRSGKLLRENGNKFLDSREAMYEIYPSQAGDGYFISANTPCKLVVIQCANSTLARELGVVTEDAPVPLRILGGEPRTRPYAKDFEPTTGIINAFTDIMDKRDLFEAELRCWFVEGKSKEIIASLLQLMIQRPVSRIGGNRISRRDRQRILEAREVIIAHIDHVPTIPELARMVGVNQTKLKAAFKEMFGQTIRAFVTEQQMRAAARLLVSTNLNVSQIGQSLGYRHSGNFSQAFKRYFGRVPREYRRSMNFIDPESDR